MKALFIFLLSVLFPVLIFGQYKIDTSFYSEALGEEKLVDVYFPPGYDENLNWHFPVIYYLHGYGGNQNTMNTMMSLLTQMINDNLIEPIIMVGADNSPGPLGGSGYVNSILWGNYEDYMVYDLVQWIDNTFRTIEDKNARGLFGQSMGGYGAFRYGILHNDIYCALASHAGPLNFNDEFFRTESQQKIQAENSGPPYFYTCGGNRPSTILNFLGCGMYAPDTNTPQTYISPTVVQFLMDENGDYIDTVLAKQEPYDIIYMIDSLSANDSVGILFGCGANDSFYLYPGTLALKDTLDQMVLPYEFFDHDGGHNPPLQFKEDALMFLDSILMNPGPQTNIDQAQKTNENPLLICYPNPCKTSLNVKYELYNTEIVEIEVFSMSGKRIKNISLNNKEKGIQEFNLNIQNFTNGIYLLALRTNRSLIIKRFVKN